MESQTIRVSKATRDILRDLAAKAQTTMAAIAEEAVKEYEQREFWENYFAGYNALRADPVAWADYDEFKRREDIAGWDRDPRSRVLVLRSCLLNATLERARAGRGSPDPAPSTNSRWARVS
jgi:hypothetical protein